MALGFLLIIICTAFPVYTFMFYLSLAAAVFIGFSALGESVVLGYLKEFPSEMVGFFSSGTGFAGIFGAGYIILTKAIGL